MHSYLTKQSNTEGVCAVIWLTGETLENNVIGMAWVGGACNHCGRDVVGISASEPVIDGDDSFLSAVNLEAWIVGHELGHLLGADHVGHAEYLMSPSIATRNPSLDPYKIHSNSQNDILSYIQKCEPNTCLKMPEEKHVLKNFGHIYHHHHTWGTTHDAIWATGVLIVIFLLIIALGFWYIP